MMTENELLLMVGLTYKNTRDEPLYWRAFASADNTYPIFINEVLWVNDAFLIKTDEYKWSWHADIVHGNYRGEEHFARSVGLRFDSLLEFDQHLWLPQNKTWILTDHLRARCQHAFPDTWRRTLPSHLAQRPPADVITALLSEMARAYYWLDNLDITNHERFHYARDVTLAPYIYTPFLVDIENEIREEEENGEEDL